MNRWETRTQTPLLALAVLFLAAYAWPILDPELGSFWDRGCTAVQLMAWIAFAVDYLVRLRLSRDRRRFLRTNVLDLVIIVLPMLRPLRALRLVMLLRIFNRSATTTFRGRVVTYVSGGVVLIGFVAALAVLDAERENPAANIQTFGDALWWAAATVTTVGYGDRYPITWEGRLVAVGLMVSGIALLGTVTATLASWFSERVRAEEVAAESLATEVRELRAELAALNQGREAR